jgi:hypothetical protein
MTTLQIARSNTLNIVQRKLDRGIGSGRLEVDEDFFMTIGRPGHKRYRWRKYSARQIIAYCISKANGLPYF